MFLSTSMPFAWAALGWALLLPFAWHGLGQVAAAPPLRHAQQHLWLAGSVALALLWHLQAAAACGLLGAALYALVFGRPWARLGLLAAVALHTLLGGGTWSGLGLNGLLLAVVPAALAGLLQRQIEQRLPRNLFVFIIGNGLFVTLAVTAATSVLLLAAGALTGTRPADTDRFAYALLLAWGEALASGMLFSSLVIFGPQFVLTYRQDLYLPRRRGI